MFDNYRVVCVTPAGRKRYLEILFPYILRSPLVDEYHLWLNTGNVEDRSYVERLMQLSSKVQVFEPTTGRLGSNEAIGQFFRRCIDPETIYIRFDDDIVYLETDFFEKILRFRIANPEFFLIFPNIVNHSICTYIEVKRGFIDPGVAVQPWCGDWTTWWLPRFAEQLHRKFIGSVEVGRESEWYFRHTLVSLCRFPLNCMTWFGSDFAQFGGNVGPDEDEYLSILRPLELMRANCICGDVIASHFAFYTQRDYLETTDVLDAYRRIADGHVNSKANNAFSSETRNVWIPRLLEAIHGIHNAATEELSNPLFVAKQIKTAGLVFDLRVVKDTSLMNAGHYGLWQLPMQLARALVELRNYRIATMLEIGTGSGWTTCIMTAYLRKFNTNLRVITVDATDSFDSRAAIAAILPIEFQPGLTSEAHKEHEFDLVFIDANHSYKGCSKDFEAVGRHASICMFHDINDRFVRDDSANQGGVPRLWAEIKSQLGPDDRVFEFLDKDDGNGENIMGIGLIVRAKAFRHRDTN